MIGDLALAAAAPQWPSLHPGAQGDLEIVASATAEAFSALKAAPVRLGLPEHPTPSSRGLIPGFYPDSQKIVAAVGRMLGLDQSKLDNALKTLTEQRKNLPIDVPDPFFKGPF